MGAIFDHVIGFLTSPQVMISVVWTGMAVLTISLVVLMRTRWGHQQPLRKCVVLSLFAHVLFAAYATTIHIVRTHPHPGHSWAMRITELVDGAPDGATQGVKDGDTLEPTPWDHPAASPVDPLLAAIPPLPGDPPSGLSEPIVPEHHARSDAEATEALEHVAENRFDSGPSVADAEPSLSAAPAAPIEVPEPTRQAAPVTGPTVAELDPISESAIDPALPAVMAGTAALLASQAPAIETERALGPEPGVLSEGPPLVAPSPAPHDRIDAGMLVAIRPRDTTTEGSRPPSSAAQPAKPHELPEIYSERTPSGRQRAAASFGGSAETEAAVNSALDWLVKHQSADGRWDASDHGAGRETLTLGQNRQNAGAKADTGLTGLALLAFLGAGHTHQAGTHAATVARGIDYLIATQAPDGNLAGEAETYAYMYCHGMATLALSEAYAMSGDERLARTVRRAINYTVTAQNLGSGGWRYKPPFSRDRGDTSQLGWQLMSLKSAEQSGIAIPERTRQGVVRYLNSVSSGTHGGLASYRPEERVTHPMTAEALVCREFLGLSLPSAASEAGDYLLAHAPGEGPDNFYYWYYGTLAMFQLQGEHWTKWNQAMTKVLTHSQRADGDVTGSWDPDSLWGGYGGRVFSTSLGALCLEVYYRYLPLYTVRGGQNKPLR